MIRENCRNALLVALLVSMGTALCQSVAAADPGVGSTFVNSAQITWGDAPPSLPKGAKLVVLYGDPGKEGPFTIRLMMPAGYKVAPHWHSQAEQLTVISGTFYIGLGDKGNAAQAHALQAGGYHSLPGKAHHFAFSKVPTVIQISGSGPFDIFYIDPSDDPQKK